MASTGADDSSPVKLPAVGPVPITFSSGRQIDFAVNDLSEFGIGEGILETPDIPVGEFISVKAAVGSHNPITVSRPSLTLDPVIGTISAEQVARYREQSIASSKGRGAAGVVGAAYGGVQGGLSGGVAGGAIGAGIGSVLGPLGALVGGGIGAFAGAAYGARQGGIAGGHAGEAVYDFLAGDFSGDFDLTARLDQGQVRGAIGLHYTPFLRLTLGATGFQWLARIFAELQTVMNLTARATIALSGSTVVLHFRDGELVRTVFTLTPAATLDLDLVAQARLRLGGSFLNILEESAGRSDSLLSGEYTTGEFPLFSIGGTIGAQTALTFAKGSPMEVLNHHLTAAQGGVRERFVTGLRGSGPQIPLLKRRAPLDEKSRTGLNPNQAILMDWHKPADWYPDYLTRPSATRRAERILKFPHQTYDNGLAMGVDDWPYEGRKLIYRGGDEPRGRGVARFMRELREEGITLEDDLAYKADIDHVIDWAFSGADDETNLWPLESSANRSAGTTQNRFQQVWWANGPGEEPRQTKIEDVPTGRHFEIASIRAPD